MALGCSASSFAQQEPVAPVAPDQVVGVLEKLGGVTPGARRNHINGICASGSFTGSKDIAAYSRSALFSGKPVPVEARFSLAGGNPKTPDNAKSPRGMAVEFALPGKHLQHFTMLNIPVFAAATPQSFYDGLVAGIPDAATGKPDPEKLKAYKASHPDSLPLAEFMGKNNPPASYANSDFFGVHTFKFINKKNQTTLVRWRFVPEDGVKRLSDDAVKSGPTKFLDQDLMTRMQQGPVRWNMMLTIGKPGDEQKNSTLYWPTDRQEVKAGVLTMTAAVAQAGAACEKINFDPLVMSDGVAATDDPVLLFRSPAYAISYAKRLSGQ